MKKPNFLGVGGHKCASTWLSECLRTHPDIYMSDVKEIHFFTQFYDLGMNWYLKHFQGAPESARRVGEFCTLYLYDPDAPARIARDLGKIKILASVREPVGRFLSHYKHQIRLGALPKAEYARLTAEAYQSAVARCPALLTRGLYSEGIRRFQELFGAENVLVVLKDDVDQAPGEVVKKVYGFLGVDDTVKSAIANKRVSSGIVPRIAWLERVRDRVFQYFKRVNPRVITLIRKMRIAEIYRKLNAETKELSVDPAVREILYAYYEQEIRDMEELLGRDLTAWRA